MQNAEFCRRDLESRQSFAGGVEHGLGSGPKAFGLPVASVRRPAEWLGHRSRPSPLRKLNRSKLSEQRRDSPSPLSISIICLASIFAARLGFGWFGRGFGFWRPAETRSALPRRRP